MKSRKKIKLIKKEKDSSMDEKENVKCYYEVKARTAFFNKDTGENEFRARIKKFEYENPIEARKAAFRYRNEFICGLLTLALGMSEEEIGWNNITKQFSNLSEREIRKLLSPLLEPNNTSRFEPDYTKSDENPYILSPTILNKEDNSEEEINWNPPDDTLSWYAGYYNGIWVKIRSLSDDSLRKYAGYYNGIWVVFNHNDPDYKLEGLGDIVIDKINQYEEPLPTPPLPQNLMTELEFYKKYHYDTENFETEVRYFDDETYSEGYYENDGETKEEAEHRHFERTLYTFKFLSTPFDWSGYDKIYWWENGESKENDNNDEYNREIKLPISIEKAFQGGEGQTCEFKPGIYNLEGSDRDMGFEIAKTICAFLNADGGYLFIGVSDDGKAIDLKAPDGSRDQFEKYFKAIKKMYLPVHLAYTYNGKFYDIEGKPVFVVEVFPNEEPVFVKKKDSNGKLIGKEYYVRSGSSSNLIWDNEELVKYCIKRDRLNRNN